MIGDDLLNEAARGLEDGQRALAATIKRLVAASGDPVAATLDYADDATFLEPSLFTHFLDPSSDGALEDALSGRMSCFPSDTGIADVGEIRSGCVEPAFDVISRVCPAMYDALRTVVRRVVVFSSPEGDSFASPAAHGAVFLRPPPDANEVFFIEDLAHQGGHVWLTALTVDGGAWFACDPDRAVVDGDHRSAYVAFHGVFTECLMCLVLARCLEEGVFEGRRLHESVGRVSFAMKRLELDLPPLLEPGVMDGRGAAILKMIGEVFDEIFARHGGNIARCNLANQPYTFSYGRFLELNDALPLS